MKKQESAKVPTKSIILAIVLLSIGMGIGVAMEAQAQGENVRTQHALFQPQNARNPNAQTQNTLPFYNELQPLGPQERILKSTQAFINTPTGLNPLGEGTGLDPNPTYSLKKFDCTTYVETNLAIACSKTQQDIPGLLNKIRYHGGVVDFFQRNHFMVTDWIPENTKNGVITEITREMSQDKAAYRLDKKNLNKTTWFYHRVIDLMDGQKKSSKDILATLAKVPAEPSEALRQDEKTTYLLASYFRANESAMAEKLPPLSIAMFIRNIPSSPTLVSHMGFIIKRDGKLYFNHAPQAKPWKVQEVLLEDYFTDMDDHRAPIEGLLLFKIGSGI